MCTKRLCQWLLLSIALLCSHALFTAAHAQASAEAARLMFVFGEVRIERDSLELVGQRNTILLEGDSISTGAGASAQIRFSDQSLMALRPDSTIIITRFRYDAANPATGEQKTQLLRGGLRAITGAIGSAQPQAVEFTTPVATMGIRGTELRIVHVIRGSEAQFNNAPAGTYLQVLRGAVAMRTNAGEQLVAPGQSFYVPDLDSVPQPLSGSADEVFADDPIQQPDEDETPPPAGDSGTNNPPPSVINQQPLTPPEQAQQDQGQQQAQDIIAELDPDPDPDPDPTPDPDPMLTSYGINSTGLGYLQRNEVITSSFGDNGELRQLTGSWYTFQANAGASPAFAQSLTASDWHLGAQSTISHGYWAADTYRLTPVTPFTGAGSSFHYLLSDYTLASFTSAQQLGLELYSNQLLQFALQPNYGVLFSNGSRLEFQPNGLLSVDFSSNAVKLDLQFTYLSEVLRTLYGVTSITELYANGMSLAELGNNPILQQGRLFGSFSGSSQWGIDAFLAGIYLRIAHDGSSFDGWGTLVFGNDCYWNFPCRVIDSDYRFMGQLGWAQGLSIGGAVELNIMSGPFGSWLATDAGNPTGALLGQRADTSAGSYRFLALDSAGLVGGSSEHSLQLETSTGPLHIYWGYWQGGSYDLHILQGNAHDYQSTSLDSSGNYHFIFANQRAPDALPEQVSFSYKIAGGSGLVGDVTGLTINPLVGNMVVDFTAAEVALMLLFEVSGEHTTLSGIAAITDLLGQSAGGMQLLGEGFFTSGSLYGQFVGGDFEALLGLLRAVSDNEEFRGTVVFTRNPALGETLAELGFTNGGMLGASADFSLLSNAANTRILNLLAEHDEFVPSQQIGSQGRFDLISAITADEQDYWTTDWGFTDASGNHVAVRFGAFAPGSYRITDADGDELSNALPYFFAVSNLLTDITAIAPAGAMSFDLVAQSELLNAATGDTLQWYGNLLVNFDAGDVGIAIHTNNWNQHDPINTRSTDMSGSLLGHAPLSALFGGHTMDLQGYGYWHGGGGSLSGRFVGSQYDAIMALISAYTAEREAIFQGAGAFAQQLELNSLSYYGGIWTDDQLLGGNGILHWLVDADGVYSLAPNTDNSFAFPMQVRNSQLVVTVSDYYEAYQGSRIWLDDEATGSPSDISVQWTWWNPGSYYLQQQQANGSVALVANDRPLVQLLASDVTVLGTTPSQQQLVFDLQFSDRINRLDDSGSLYLNNGVILVDFDSNSVELNLAFTHYSYNQPGAQNNADTNDYYGETSGLLYGSAAIASLYQGDAITLTGEGLFEQGGGTFWGRFIGSNHHGVMAMLRAWFDAEANDDIFGMLLFNRQMSNSLAHLDWNSGSGVLSGNRDMLLFSDPSELLVVRDNYGYSSSYDYARLVRITSADFNVQGTGGQGFFDRFTVAGIDSDIELRWGYWSAGNYRFTPANTPYRNDSHYWFVGADKLTAPSTMPLSKVMSFALYGTNMMSESSDSNSYLYTNGGNLTVDFDANYVDLNIDFSRYNYDAAMDEVGSLSGSGSVADLFKQNWLALSGTGLFAAGNGEFAGRFIGDSYQGVMGLLRAWDGNEYFSGALIFGAQANAVTADSVEWGYWQVGNQAISGYFAPPAELVAADPSLLQQALLQQLQGAEAQAQRQVAQQLQQLANEHPLRPGFIRLIHEP